MSLKYQTGVASTEYQSCVVLTSEEFGFGLGFVSPRIRTNKHKGSCLLALIDAHP